MLNTYVPLVIILCVLQAAGHGAAQDLKFEQVRRLLDAGAYAEAERASKDLCGRVEAQYGHNSTESARALDLLVEALIRNGQSAVPTTVVAAERAVRVKEQLYRRSHLDTTTSLDNLAWLKLERGEFRDALPLAEEVLAIRSSYLPADDAGLADALDRLGLALLRLQRFGDATSRLTQSLALRETRSNEAPVPLARTLELLGWLKRYGGDYPAARTFFGRALAVRTSASLDHPEIATLLALQGDLQWFQGEVANARKTWTDALALGERTLGSQHPDIAALLRRVALTAAAFGELGAARQFRERGLRIAESSMTTCHPEFAALLNAVAVSKSDDGEFNDAQKLYQRGLDTVVKCFGASHANVATTIHNLANVAAKMGDFAEAERLQRRAVEVWSTSLKPDHQYVGRALNALARVVELRGQRERARAIYARALIILRRAVGPTHPDVAVTLINIARVKADSGDVPAALRDVEQAIDIYQRGGRSDEPDYYGRAIALRGDIEAVQHNFAAARTSFTAALSTRQQVFGQAHPLTADARARLASADFALGAYRQAVDEALDAERVGRNHLQFTVRYLPERQGLAYADKRPKGLDIALSILAAGHLDEPAAILDNLIESRGVILDELAARSRSIDSPDPELAPLTAHLVAARQRFANLMVRSVTEGEQFRRAMLDEARTQKEEAERALAERSATMRAEMNRANVGLAEIRAAMPTQSALVSIVRYDRTSFVKNAQGITRARVTPSYIALVARAGETEIKSVPLGAAAAIDALVAAWRQQATAIVGASSPADAEKTYRAAGTALRQRIWNPLEADLKDAGTVFVVPDGALNLVSLAALPVSQTRYLVEQGPVIHYLSAERDLVAPDRPSPSTGLLALGGAAFDDASVFTGSSKRTGSPLAKKTTDRTTGSTLRSACGTLQSARFEPLAGTLSEIREIAGLWTESGSRILERRNASEREFKQTAPGRRVLHLATHGFFLDGACAPAAPGTRSVGGLATAAGGTPAKTSNPLLLSGLALAGANHRAAAGPTDEDGILTAEEVTGLNLQGVEWAVLSACNTGVGEVKAGEGVFGLRRAFQVAGVRTVIMSLWPVDDQATRVWMRALYQNRLQKRLDTADAVRAASLGALRARRARGESTHPFYWAAFVAAGDWR